MDEIGSLLRSDGVDRVVFTGEDHGDGGDGVWSLLFVVEVEMCLKMGRAVHKLTECLIRRMWLLPQLTARSSSRK